DITHSRLSISSPRSTHTFLTFCGTSTGLRLCHSRLCLSTATTPQNKLWTCRRKLNKPKGTRHIRHKMFHHLLPANQLLLQERKRTLSSTKLLRIVTKLHR